MRQRIYRKRNRTTPQTAAAVVLLFLTACAGNNETEAAAKIQEIPPATIKAAPNPAPAIALPTPPPPINDDPVQIIGMNPPALDELLGEPVRVRRDGPAEIRQYRITNVCDLDAFVYRDSAGQRVTHVEFRYGTERLDEAGGRACLRRMLTPDTTS